VTINVDVYYCGLAGEELQVVSDRFLKLSQQAEQAGAHAAALHLADASTQLLDLGKSLDAAVAGPPSEYPVITP
jgi:hypothetical protein